MACFTMSFKEWEIFVEGAGVLGGKLNKGMCDIIFKRANWEKDADTGCAAPHRHAASPAR